MTPRWVTPTVIGIIAATFFSDVGHEMVTAVLPMYLASVGLGAATLGAMEGAADLAASLSKLAGGAVGHRVAKKRPWVAGGYLVTMIGTGLIAIAQTITLVISLRAFAWAGRGFRSPMRDFMLADEVESTHYGRAYGIERSADMLGAVVGPLLAAGLIALGSAVPNVILLSMIPSGLAVVSIVVLTRDRPAPAPSAASPQHAARTRVRLPRTFWLFTIGVALFGLGDFSRTFLIYIAAKATGETTGFVTTAVLLYAGHNLVSGIAALPAGHFGDRYSKTKILIAGYALGVATNVLFAFGHDQLPIVIGAIGLSGIYIAIQETLEKAVVAQVLSREQRSLGLGILASANAVGDLLSSVFVGVMLRYAQPELAFAVPAAVGALGVVWMTALVKRGVVR
ncbi:MAG: MFS transporter [Kofleriaceae bacterium]